MKYGNKVDIRAYISEETKQKLMQKAFKENKSVSQIVREILSKATATQQRLS